MPEQSRSAIWMGPLAAVSAALAALTCCLPLPAILAAAGLAGAAAWLDPARPYLMGASVAVLIAGFVQAYRAPKCATKRNPATLVLLWAATLLVATLLLFPQWIANFLADRLPPP